MVAIPNSGRKLRRVSDIEREPLSILKKSQIIKITYSAVTVHPCQVTGYQPIPFLTEANHLLCMIQSYSYMKHSVKDALSHFKTVDPILYGIAVEYEITDVVSHKDYYLDLYDSIVSQQLSVKAANTIMGRLRKLYSKEIITPERTVSLNSEKIRAAGVSYAKISYLKDLSQRVVDGRLELTKFLNMTDDNVMKELLEVRGIGPWTAEMFMMFSLGRPDIFSYGDQGLKNAMKKLYNKENHFTLEEALEISSRWSPYRTYACRILWKSLDNEPLA